MAPKYPLMAVALLACGVAPLRAADFWQSTKFTEWNQKQVKQMLSDSPWARSVFITVHAPAGDRKGKRGEGPEIAEDETLKGGSEGGGGRHGGGGGGGMHPIDQPPATEIALRWVTALPLKQALARARFGEKAGTDPEALKSLSRQEERYILGTFYLPAFVMKGDPAQAKSGCVIKIKGKPDIQAESLVPDAIAPGAHTVNLFVIFPREQNGAPLITEKDNEIEVDLNLGAVKVNRKFKLKDMVFNGKLEM
jgi:hypothetical protein